MFYREIALQYMSGWGLRALTIAAMAAVLTLAACEEQSPVATEDPAEQAAGSWPERAAYGIAVALQAPDLRQQVLVDLRDSPFQDHQIRLSSYLSGTRGRALAEAAANALAMEIEQFLARVRTLEGYALSVPSVLQRVRWTGGSNIVVVGTAANDSARQYLQTVTGYLPSGRAVSVPTRERLERTLLLIAPSEVNFGRAPERTRANAPMHSRSTIAEFGPPAPEEAIGGRLPRHGVHAEIAPSMTPEPRFTHVGRKHVYDYNIGCSYESLHDTTADSDHDRDGLVDACEYDLAYAFRPILTYHILENCGEGREPHWTVHEDPEGWIVAAYLLSYYDDCGALGHYGDSEFLIAWLNETGGEWRIYYLTTSAHWNTAADATELSHWSDLDYNPDGRPLVYVSWDKHANYRSIQYCEVEHEADDCDGAYQGHVASTSVIKGNNIGTYEYRFDIDPDLGGGDDCTASEYSSRGGVECYFTDSKFRGWVAGADDAAGGYIEMLEAADIAHANVSY